MLSKQLVNAIKVKKCKPNIKCEVCITFKINESPYPKSDAYRAIKMFHLLHSDVCGQIYTPHNRRKKIFCHFHRRLFQIDDKQKWDIRKIYARENDINHYFTIPFRSSQYGGGEGGVVESKNRSLLKMVRQWLVC